MECPDVVQTLGRAPERNTLVVSQDLAPRGACWLTPSGFAHLSERGALATTSSAGFFLLLAAHRIVHVACAAPPHLTVVGEEVSGATLVDEERPASQSTVT